MPGIDVVEVLVIDDGSRDGTADVARALRRRPHRAVPAATRGWPPRSWPASTPSLKAGADFIVNTDADNQYAAHDIPKLLAPLLSGEADIVIGDRNIGELRHMSWRKRQLQRLGSWVVRQVSNTRCRTRRAASAPTRAKRRCA